MSLLAAVAVVGLALWTACSPSPSSHPDVREPPPAPDETTTWLLPCPEEDLRTTGPVPTWATCAGSPAFDSAGTPVPLDDGSALAAWVSKTADAPERGVTAAEVVLARITSRSVEVLGAWPISGLDPAVSVYEGPRAELSASPLGGAFLRVVSSTRGPRGGVVDLGAGPHDLPYVVEVDATGRFIRDLCAPEGCDVSVVASGNAALALRTADALGVRVERLERDGRRSLVWSRDAAGAVSGPVPEGCGHAAFSPDGALVCAGEAPGTVAGRDPSLPPARNPVLVVLEPDGSRRWSVQIPGIDAHVAGVGTTSAGDVLVAGSFVGEAQVGDDLLSRPPAPGLVGKGFTLRLDAAGAPRWARVEEGELLDAAFAADGSIAATLLSERLGVPGLLMRSGGGDAVARWSPGLDVTGSPPPRPPRTQVLGLAMRADGSVVATVTVRDAAAPAGPSWDVGVLWFAPRVR